MVFGRFFGKGQTSRFECVYTECKSLCCKENMVVLNEDDAAAFERLEINLADATEHLGLNDFLALLGSTPIKQLDGLEVVCLKKDERGNCRFLNSEDGGCKIYDDRPYFCREFPFKFSKGGIKKKDPICPGLGRGEEMDVLTLKDVLGLSGLDVKAPLLVGDESKLKTSKALMGMVFRLMR
jgi:Fe-S-cluster containining protein